MVWPELSTGPASVINANLLDQVTDRVRTALAEHTALDVAQMHESVHRDDPTRFTRPWFSWANAMFCELVLDLSGLTLDHPLR